MLAILLRYNIDIGALIPPTASRESVEQLSSYQTGKKADQLKLMGNVLEHAKTAEHLLYAIELSGIFRDIMRPTPTKFLPPPTSRKYEKLFSDPESNMA